MGQSPNRSVCQDPAAAHVRLRPDIRCSLQQSGRQPFVLLEDPLGGQFYRLGMREWTFARLLDGNRSLREVIAQANDELSEDPLSLTDALGLVRWLCHAGLASVTDETSHPVFDLPVPPRSAAAAVQAFNPLFIRIPLFNPDRLLQRVLPYFAWTVSPAAMVVWSLICLLGFAQVIDNWSEFRSSLHSILAPSNWALLLATWVLLKLVHETYHGIACRRFGGYVPSCGVMLILFSPIAFVDVSSSWRFRSKWQRIFTAAAGMYAEFFVAAMAALYWANTSDGIDRQLAHNMVTMASLSTLLFNANFLMRFDGYYILSDLLEVQNLYALGQQYMRYFGRKYLLGLPATNPLARQRRPVLIRIYGFATLLWRWVFYTGIVIAAAAMFQGAGILLALIAAVGWFVVPLIRLVGMLLSPDPAERPRLVRLGLTLAFLGVLGTAIVRLPVPGGISAVGIVEYEPLDIVRTRTSGFVRQVPVQPGDQVTAGQLLARVENPITQLRLDEVKLAVEQCAIRLRILHHDWKLAQYQAEQEKMRSLLKQQSELEQEVAGLHVKSPRAGQVIARNLEDLVGQYVRSGTDLLAVADEAHKQIQLVVDQESVDQFVKAAGDEVEVRIRGRTGVVVTAKLLRTQPRATQRLPHPALASPHGGPLAVRARSLGGSSEQGAFELMTPHFLALVQIPADCAEQIRAGELARVRLQHSDRTLGEYFVRSLRNWVTRKSHSHVKS